MIPPSRCHGFDTAAQRTRSQDVVGRLWADAVHHETLQAHYGSSGGQEWLRARRARSMERFQQFRERVDDLRNKVSAKTGGSHEVLCRSLLPRSPRITPAETVTGCISDISDAASKQPPMESYQIATVVFKHIVNNDFPATVVNALLQIEAHGWTSIKWRHGITLLHWAGGKGFPALCRHLLFIGANPCAVDHGSRTAYDYAIEAQQAQAAELLQAAEILHVADVPKASFPSKLSPRSRECLALVKTRGWHCVNWAGGHTLLHVAARKRLPATCALLVEYGADVRHGDDDGQRALDHMSLVAPTMVDAQGPLASSGEKLAPSPVKEGEKMFSRERTSESSALMPDLAIPRDGEAVPLSRTESEWTLSCSVPSSSIHFEDMPCLSSDESPPLTGRIRFRGSGSIESVHFIDTEAPADLHLSRSEQPPHELSQQMMHLSSQYIGAKTAVSMSSSRSSGPSAAAQQTWRQQENDHDGCALYSRLTMAASHIANRKSHDDHNHQSRQRSPEPWVSLLKKQMKLNEPNLGKPALSSRERPQQDIRCSGSKVKARVAQINSRARSASFPTCKLSSEVRWMLSRSSSTSA